MIYSTVSLWLDTMCSRYHHSWGETLKDETSPVTFRKALPDINKHQILLEHPRYLDMPLGQQSLQCLQFNLFEEVSPWPPSHQTSPSCPISLLQILEKNLFPRCPICSKGHIIDHFLKLKVVTDSVRTILRIVYVRLYQGWLLLHDGAVGSYEGIVTCFGPFFFCVVT